MWLVCEDFAMLSYFGPQAMNSGIGCMADRWDYCYGGWQVNQVQSLGASK